MTKTFKSHDGPVLAMAFISENEILTGGDNGEIFLWDVNDLNKKKSFIGHTGKVIQIRPCATHQDVLFLSSSDDGLVISWGKENGSILRKINIDDQVRPKTGRLIINNIYAKYIAISPDMDETILQLNRNYPPYTWNYMSNSFFMLGGAEQIPAGGNAAAFGHNGLAITNSGCALYIYDMDYGKIVCFSGMPEAYYDHKNIYYPKKDDLFDSVMSKTIGLHFKPVTFIDFSSDDRFFVTGGEDLTLRLWPVKETVKTRFNFKPVVLEGHKSRITGVVFIGNGDRIASTDIDGSLLIWDVADGKLIKQYSSTTGYFPPRTNKPIISLSVSPSGKTIATGSPDGCVQIWDIQ